MQMLKKVAIAFVGTLAIGMLVGLVVGRLYSSPQLTGGIAELSGYLAIAAALLAARQHRRQKNESKKLK